MKQPVSLGDGVTRMFFPGGCLGCLPPSCFSRPSCLSAQEGGHRATFPGLPAMAAPRVAQPGLGVSAQLAPPSLKPSQASPVGLLCWAGTPASRPATCSLLTASLTASSGTLEVNGVRLGQQVSGSSEEASVSVGTSSLWHGRNREGQDVFGVFLSLSWKEREKAAC